MSEDNKHHDDVEEMDTDIAVEETSDETSEEMSEDGVEQEASLFLQEEEESEGFLPDASDDEVEEMEAGEAEVSVEGSELDGFESAEIEEVEFVEEERLESIVESILFASDRPVSLASLKLVFKGTNVKTNHLKRALDQLAVEYAGGRRGVTLEEVPGGYQLRTKIDNLEFLRRTLKARSFKLSGPALEVLSIVAYKQPTVKSEVDEIRGVESGHLLRALMEKNLVCFEGKSELPGRPMQYATTRKFLEIFGLRNLKELPTLSQIDELLPEGIDEQQATEKPTLSSLTDSLSETIGSNYSQGEDELEKIQSQLEEIATSTNFFEEEKRRQAEKRDEERAQNIREALAMGEPVSTRDANWMKKYDEALAAGTTLVAMKEGELAAKKAAFANMGSKKSDENEVNEIVENAEEITENAEAISAEAAEITASSEIETEEFFVDGIIQDDGTIELVSEDEISEELDFVEDEESEEMLLTEEANEDEDEEEALDEELSFLGEAADIDGDDDIEGEGNATV